MIPIGFHTYGTQILSFLLPIPPNPLPLLLLNLHDPFFRIFDREQPHLRRAAPPQNAIGNIKTLPSLLLEISNLYVVEWEERDGNMIER